MTTTETGYMDATTIRDRAREALDAVDAFYRKPRNLDMTTEEFVADAKAESAVREAARDAVASRLSIALAELGDAIADCLRLPR